LEVKGFKERDIWRQRAGEVCTT